jgi:hypothetical protein
MAEGLIIEFEGATRELYDGVNAIVQVETTNPNATGWPSGLAFHAAGETQTGAIVFEVWDSRADQERFMADRLGPALQQAGAPAPARMEWIDLLAATTIAR